jgi:3-oxoacyl-[acyl-carrier protein] reductase
MVVESTVAVCSFVTHLPSSYIDTPFFLDYAASKGGLMGMMKNLSSRLAQYNISVNDVAPAMIGATGMIPNPEAVPGVVETIPLGRFGQPDEVANVVEMFAKTGYCTGQSLVVAGGLK